MTLSFILGIVRGDSRWMSLEHLAELVHVGVRRGRGRSGQGRGRRLAHGCAKFVGLVLRAFPPPLLGHM